MGRLVGIVILVVGCGDGSPASVTMVEPLPDLGAATSVDLATATDFTVPHDLSSPPDLGAAPGCATRVAAVGESSCAVVSDGRLFCWGRAPYPGTAADDPQWRPAPVEDALSGNVVDVSIADWTCVLHDDASVWCRGGWSDYEPGLYARRTGSPDPMKVLDGVASLCPSASDCAIGRDGTLTGWELPYWYMDLSSRDQAPPSHADLRLYPMVGSAPVLMAGVGDPQGCALRPDHTLWCWSISSTDPTVSQPWSQLADGVAELGVAWPFGCFRKLDGSVWCWGQDFFGALGDGGGHDSATPVRVTLEVPTRSLFVGSFTVCAVGNDTLIRCWGTLPGAPTNSAAKPTVVLDATGAPFTGVRQLAFGANHACALREDGNVWCWGADDEGQLGIGAPQTNGMWPPVSTPTRVPLPCAP